MTRILIVNGHPDPAEGHFVHALTDAYAEGARAVGHEVRRIDVGILQFDSIRNLEDFNDGKPPAVIRRAQEDLAWAQHWLLAYPLWLGSMPGRFKSFVEQVLRPGFAFGELKGRGLPKKLLKGRSARIVVTMGMPGLFYRTFYRAHSLKSFERNILAFVGIAPVRASLVGSVEKLTAAQRRHWLARMKYLGAKAS
jgi:putative NADPH-quinone reductase